MLRQVLATALILHPISAISMTQDDRYAICINWLNEVIEANSASLELVMRKTGELPDATQSVQQQVADLLAAQKSLRNSLVDYCETIRK